MTDAILKRKRRGDDVSGGVEIACTAYGSKSC
jgi:hypothetical protein